MWFQHSSLPHLSRGHSVYHPAEVVAPQLADETLFLSYPKEELESKFLVDPSPLRACSVLFAKAYNKPFWFKTTDVCALLFSVQCFTCIILFKMSRFCAMHFSE